MAQRLDVRYVQFYTDGSAARKVAPAEPFKLLHLPRVKKQKRVVLRIDPVATAGIVLAAVMFVMLIVGAVNLQNVRNEAAAMESYVQTLQQENERLQTTYNQQCDLDAVHETAMALGLVPKDQVKHVSLQLPENEQPEQPGVWERFYSFLTGLFA